MTIAPTHRSLHLPSLRETRATERRRKARTKAGMEKRSMWDRVRPKTKDKRKVRPKNFKDGFLNRRKNNNGKKARSRGPINWSSPAPGIVSRHGSDKIDKIPWPIGKNCWFSCKSLS